MLLTKVDPWSLLIHQRREGGWKLMMSPCRRSEQHHSEPIAVLETAAAIFSALLIATGVAKLIRPIA